jgi:arabinogalactan oligomer/maltooligosaccharide transport system permease protein
MKKILIYVLTMMTLLMGMSTLILAEPVDSEAPTSPSRFQASPSLTKVLLTWNESTDNVAVTGYEVFVDGQSVTTTSDTQHKVVDLAPNTGYSFYVVAKDEAGNVSSPSITLDVKTVQDTIPPSIPVGVKVFNTSYDSIGLTWTASTDNLAMNDYVIYLDGKEKGSSKVTTFTISGLDASTKYLVNVVARDAAGNVSTMSTDRWSTTTAPPEKPMNPLIGVLILAAVVALFIFVQRFLSRTVKNVVRLSFSYILLVIIAIACIYPALWVIAASFKVGNSLYSETLIPRKMTLDHYYDLFVGEHSDFVIWFMNTIKVSTLSMIFGTILTITAAYALSRFKFTGRQNTLTVLLILGMFPGFMAMIAIYVLMDNLNLLDTHLALIIVYAAGAPLGGVFVAKGFYDTIPKSLEEAARIDGATQLGIFLRIVLPLSKPMLTFISLTIFTGTWVDFIFAKIIIQSSEKLTLAVGLFQLISDRNLSYYNTFAAGAVLAAIPITLLFLFLQRFLVEGLTAGASKG